ncbi:unnamed protein product [Lactuca virosa]|uniref:O-fucosyltransferase family protein n=1 Tax=Lactuca virosa TaxID=75947 RepID=A0AAU9PIX2_9ASTR|nr:unnamed protein product [Lactuca virosa]
MSFQIFISIAFGEIPVSLVTYMMNKFSLKHWKMTIKVWAPVQYYRDTVLPSLLEEKFIRILPFAIRLSFDAPPNVRRIPRLANYVALRFSSPLLTMGQTLVSRMKDRSKITSTLSGRCIVVLQDSQTTTIHNTDTPHKTKMKPQQMETILNTLLAHQEAEKPSLTNMEEEASEHQNYRKELMEQMDAKPSYDNYLKMQQLVFDNNYESAKLLKTMHQMQKKYEALIENLKKEVKNLLTTNIPTSNMFACLMHFGLHNLLLC